jgi:hypothetical protein
VTATAIILCVGLLFAVAIILPIVIGEKARESLEEPPDADESNGSEDRDTALPAPAPPRADQSSGSEDEDIMAPPRAPPMH